MRRPQGGAWTGIGARMSFGDMLLAVNDEAAWPDIVYFQDLNMQPCEALYPSLRVIKYI